MTSRSPAGEEPRGEEKTSPAPSQESPSAQLQGVSLSPGDMWEIYERNGRTSAFDGKEYLNEAARKMEASNNRGDVQWVRKMLGGPGEEYWPYCSYLWLFLTQVKNLPLPEKLLVPRGMPAIRGQAASKRTEEVAIAWGDQVAKTHGPCSVITDPAGWSVASEARNSVKEALAWTAKGWSITNDYKNGFRTYTRTFTKWPAGTERTRIPEGIRRARTSVEVERIPWDHEDTRQLDGWLEQARKVEGYLANTKDCIAFMEERAKTWGEAPGRPPLDWGGWDDGSIPPNEGSIPAEYNLVAWHQEVRLSKLLLWEMSQTGWDQSPKEGPWQSASPTLSINQEKEWGCFLNTIPMKAVVNELCSWETKPDAPIALLETFATVLDPNKRKEEDYIPLAAMAKYAKEATDLAEGLYRRACGGAVSLLEALLEISNLRATYTEVTLHLASTQAEVNLLGEHLLECQEERDLLRETNGMLEAKVAQRDREIDALRADSATPSRGARREPRPSPSSSVFNRTANLAKKCCLPTVATVDEPGPVASSQFPDFVPRVAAMTLDDSRDSMMEEKLRYGGPGAPRPQWERTVFGVLPTSSPATTTGRPGPPAAPPPADIEMTPVWHESWRKWTVNQITMAMENPELELEPHEDLAGIYPDQYTPSALREARQRWVRRRGSCPSPVAEDPVMGNQSHHSLGPRGHPTRTCPDVGGNLPPEIANEQRKSAKEVGELIPKHPLEDQSQIASFLRVLRQLVTRYPRDIEVIWQVTEARFNGKASREARGAMERASRDAGLDDSNLSALGRILGIRKAVEKLMEYAGTPLSLFDALHRMKRWSFDSGSFSVNLLIQEVYTAADQVTLKSPVAYARKEDRDKLLMDLLLAALETDREFADVALQIRLGAIPDMRQAGKVLEAMAEAWRTTEKLAAYQPAARSVVPAPDAAAGTQVKKTPSTSSCAYCQMKEWPPHQGFCVKGDQKARELGFCEPGVEPQSASYHFLHQLYRFEVGKRLGKWTGTPMVKADGQAPSAQPTAPAQAQSGGGVPGGGDAPTPVRTVQNQVPNMSHTSLPCTPTWAQVAGKERVNRVAFQDGERKESPCPPGQEGKSLSEEGLHADPALESSGREERKTSLSADRSKAPNEEKPYPHPLPEETGVEWVRMLSEMEAKRYIKSDARVKLDVNGRPLAGILDSGATGILVNSDFKAWSKAQGWTWKTDLSWAILANGDNVQFSEKTIAKVTWAGVARVLTVRCLEGLGPVPLFGMALVYAFGGVALVLRSDSSCEAVPILHFPRQIPVPNTIPPTARLCKGPAEDLPNPDQDGEFQFEIAGPDPETESAIVSLKRRDGEWIPAKALKKLWDVYGSHLVESGAHPSDFSLPSTTARQCQLRDKDFPVMIKYDVWLKAETASFIPIQIGTTEETRGPWVVEAAEEDEAAAWVCRRLFLPDGRGKTHALLENYCRIPIHLPTGTVVGRAWRPEIPDYASSVRTIKDDKYEDEEPEDCYPPLPEDPSEDDPIASIDLSRCRESGMKEDALRQLLYRHSKVFSKGRNDIGELTVAPHDINLTDVRPIVIPTRRKNPIQAAEVNRQIEALLEAGIIRPSNSPFSAPIVLIKKKNGEWRMCVDYRKLNSHTLPDSYPMPRVEDLLEKMGGCKVFSSLDLGSAFWQIHMTERASTYAAFSTSEGHYEPCRLFFGLRNAPPSFQRAINEIVRGLPNTSVYMDDLLIYSESPEEHLTHLEAVLERLEKNGAKLKASKSELACAELQYLGHRISAQGIRPMESITKAVEDFPVPAKAKDMKRFLGLAGYYRRFVPGYSKIAKPLTDALRGGTGRKIEWTEEMRDAFRELKKKLTQPPVLAHPDHSKPFVLTTDASGGAVGAVLSQRDDNGREHPVGYYSKRLNPTAERWNATEREFYAVIAGLAHYRHLLIGRSDLTLVTDHLALRYVINLKDTNAKYWRWVAFLEDFQPYTIIHKPGVSNVVADALSRTPEEEKVRKVTEEMATMSLLFGGNWWKEMQDKDDALKDKIARLKEIKKKEPEQRTEAEVTLEKNWLLADNGLLYKIAQDPQRKLKEFRHRLAVSREALPELTHKAHHDSLVGHRGAENLEARLTLLIHAPGLREAVEEATKSCNTCARYRRDFGVGVQHLETTLQSRKHIPFAGWSMDLVGRVTWEDPDTKMVTACNAYEYLLVCICWSTKLVELTPLKGKSAGEVAEAFVSSVVARWGAPEFILTDNGGEFRSLLMSEILSRVGCMSLFTCPYSPHMNGIAERVNAAISTSIRILTRENPKLWHLWIPFIAGVINMTPGTDTGICPLELTTGVTPVPMGLPALEPFLRAQANAISWTSSESRQRALAELRDWAAGQIAETRKRALEKRNERHPGTSPVKVSMGDFVVLDKVHPGKLDPRRTGPFFVVTPNGSGSQLFVHPVIDTEGFDPDKCKWVSTRKARVVGTPGALLPLVRAETFSLWEKIKAEYEKRCQEEEPQPLPIGGGKTTSWTTERDPGMTLRSGKVVAARRVEQEGTTGSWDFFSPIVKHHKE